MPPPPPPRTPRPRLAFCQADEQRRVTRPSAPLTMPPWTPRSPRAASRRRTRSRNHEPQPTRRLRNPRQRRRRSADQSGRRRQRRRPRPPRRPSPSSCANPRGRSWARQHKRLRRPSILPATGRESVRSSTSAPPSAWGPINLPSTPHPGVSSRAYQPSALVQLPHALQRTRLLRRLKSIRCSDRDGTRSPFLPCRTAAPSRSTTAAPNRRGFRPC